MNDPRECGNAGSRVRLVIDHDRPREANEEVGKEPTFIDNMVLAWLSTLEINWSKEFMSSSSHPFSTLLPSKSISVGIVIM